LEETERTGHSLSRTIRILVQRERDYYRRILAPDVLIVLRVAPDLAVRRKLEEIPASVRARSQEVWELDWRQTHAHVVDASRPQSEVLSEIKSIVWSEF
jgi:thymidylate kinase